MTNPPTPVVAPIVEEIERLLYRATHQNVEAVIDKIGQRALAEVSELDPVMVEGGDLKMQLLALLRERCCQAQLEWADRARELIASE